MLESEIPAETHFCGGSIISETVGISAAHCKMRVGTVDAVAGAHNIVTPEPDTQTVAVKDFLRQWFLLWNDLFKMGKILIWWFFK